MENASKALIIAGAILISILLIGIGMFLYNAAQEPIGEAQGQMSEQAIQMFNSKFTNYSGSQRGSSVKSLLSTVITSNATDSSGRKVAVTYSGASVENSFDATKISTVVNNIVNNKTYNVELTYTGAIVSGITIKQ